MSPVVHPVLQATARLAAGIAQGAAERDRNRQLPHLQVRQLCREGVLAARVPVGFGGAGLGVAPLVELLTGLAKADPNVAQAIQPHYCGVEKIRLYGSAAQQQRYLAAIAQGAMITNASAERGSAVVGQLHTRLYPAGTGWRLEGTKHYATGSLFADYLYVLCSSPDGRALALLPAAREGVHISDDWNGMGQRTTASGQVRLAQVALAADEVLHVPQWNTRRTYEGAFAQLLHAAIDLGIAQAALADAVAFARERARPVPEALAERAVDDPHIQQAVGQMANAVYAAEAVVARAAGQLDQAVAAFWANAASDALLGQASLAVAHAKVQANDAALAVSENLYRVGGASATDRDLNLDRHWRNARTHTTHDPVVYKTQLLGAWLLKDQLPPISTKV